MTNQSTLEEIRARSMRADRIKVESPSHVEYTRTIERDRFDLLRIADAFRAALRPLVRIADAYDNNELDDEARKSWGKPGATIYNTQPPDRIELYSGRGGRLLLTLADALAARDALATESPVTSHPNGFSSSGEQGAARDLARDRDYLSQADAHADEGPLGEAAARSILRIALHWMRKAYETPASPAPDKRWPFVESPGQFAARLRVAMICGFQPIPTEENLLAAVRTVLIEEPPTLAPHVRSAAIAEMAEGLERMSARAAKLEAVYAALRTWPIFADGKEIDPEIVAREGLDKAAAEEALAALDAALRAFPELSDPDEPVGPDDVRRVAEKHAAMIRASVPHRPILSNQTDAVTTALLGIGKAWSAFREGSALGDSVGWGATREAAEADLRAKEETI